MWVDRKNWVHDLAISCWDEDEGADDLIGQTTLSLLELMAQGHPDTVKVRGGACVWCGIISCILGHEGACVSVLSNFDGDV
jgi:hypothetical protein